MTDITALSEQQNSVYLAALELGSDTILNISKKAKLPRSTCYLIIDELKEMGLLSQIKKGKKTLITAHSPEKLVDLLKDKKQNLEKSLLQLEANLPRLKAIQNTRTDKPQVRFYEGLEGIKTIEDESLKANEILVLCSGYEKPDSEELDNYLNDYFEKVDAKKIKTLEILGDAPDMQPYLDRFQSELHQIKVVPRKAAITHTDKLIFDNKVVIISNEGLNGVVIENEEIASFERDLFYKLWNSID